MDFKRAREDAGLTLAKLSEMSGYAIGTISDLERTGVGGKRLRAKLSEVLGLAPASPVSAPAMLRETPPDYAVDDLITEIETLKEQLAAVERAARRLRKGK